MCAADDTQTAQPAAFPAAGCSCSCGQDAPAAAGAGQLTAAKIRAALAGKERDPAASTAPFRNYERPSWDSYFMQIADAVATRSTCLRRHIGAVLVADKRILATGYNGVPAGIAHCAKVGCLREQLGIPSGERHELCRGLHAEQNTLIQAARHGGIATDGSTVYCTAHPCVQCTKMLINAGVKRIVYRDSYPDELSSALLEEAGVELCHFEEDAPAPASAPDALAPQPAAGAASASQNPPSSAFPASAGEGA